MAILTIAGNGWQKRVSAFFRNKVYRKKLYYWYSQNNSNETELLSLAPYSDGDIKFMTWKWSEKGKIII